MAILRGEFNAGDLQALATGVSISWAAGTAQTVFTVPSGVTTAIVHSVIARSPTGTLPASYTGGFDAGATNVVSTQALTGLLSTNALQATPLGVTTVGTAGSVFSVKPLAAATGSTTVFDVLGYYI